jgi:hypothetical protein
MILSIKARESQQKPHIRHQKTAFIGKFPPFLPENPGFVGKTGSIA